MAWLYSEPELNALQRLERELGVSKVLAGLLLKQGWQDLDAARSFLKPRLADLQCPFRLTNLEAAVARLMQAMAKGERITIIGDYDVDGVTSTALLVSILREFSIFPRYTLPRRLEEGYGLSRTLVERVLHEEVPGLLIALDCGTNSVEEVALLREQGVDVVIIDHHRSKEGIPADCVLVNPHVFDGEHEPWKNLCTVGLVFKYVHGLLKKLREENVEEALRIRLKDYLDLVALGTVADLVPLAGENRILTRFGLRRLEKSQRQGINALFQVSGLQLGQVIQPMDIAFRLGPRINACGRLADATVPVEMLLSDDFGACAKLAQQLDSFNRERQDIEREICIRAEEQVEASQKDAAGIVVYGEEWHPGVVGIVAGKLSRQYNRPTIVLGREGRFCKGSGRSVPGVDLTKVLAHCDGLLDEWGGHPMAVGVRVPLLNVVELQKKFDAAVARVLSEGNFEEPDIEIACWLEPRDLGADLLEQIAELHPFGEGNPEPVFGVRSVVLERPVDVFGGEGENYRFLMPCGNGRRLSSVAWKKGHKLPPVATPLEFACKLSWNQWNGRCYPQAEVLDWRKPV